MDITKIYEAYVTKVHKSQWVLSSQGHGSQWLSAFWNTFPTPLLLLEHVFPWKNNNMTLSGREFFTRWRCKPKTDKKWLSALSKQKLHVNLSKKRNSRGSLKDIWRWIRLEKYDTKYRSNLKKIEIWS